MGVPPMSVPRITVDREVIEYLKLRIEKRKAGGYGTVAIAIKWAEQLIEAKERELAGPPEKKR